MRECCQSLLIGCGASCDDDRLDLLDLNNALGLRLAATAGANCIHEICH